MTEQLSPTSTTEKKGQLLKGNKNIKPNKFDSNIFI